MNRSNETIWPALIFIATWWALSTTRLENYAFFLAVILWFVGRSAIKLAGQAVFRLGMRAWWLLGQVAATFMLFLCAVPAEPQHAFLVVWGIAVPLVMAGGAARILYERFPQARPTFHVGAQYALGITLLLAPFLAWATGFGVLQSRAGNLLVVALAAASLYFGWRLAERPGRGAHDAHFGSADDYQRTGWSNER